MEEDYVARHEFVEYQKRIDTENDRQNKRISIMEENQQQINNLAMSIKDLAHSIETMSEEQKRQGERQKSQDARLSAIENRDGEKWRESVKYLITFAIGVATAIAGAWIKSLLGI